MDLDLGLVASFLVLLDEKHYGRAAVRLHVTSPALTKRIQRFERRPRGALTPTPAGQRFATAAVPLLTQARAAREIARVAPDRFTLRIGIPAGSGDFLRGVNLAGIARTVRGNFPEVRLVCLDVPFSALKSCLPERGVDVLWTSAPVRHPDVDSFPLAVTSARIGVVSARHAFADAPAVSVEDFCALPMLYNPSLPDEWMSPFWLGDIRPRREALLVPVDATNQAGVMRHALDVSAVTTNLEVTAGLLGPHLRAVPLVGAAPVAFQAARRRTDRRGAVAALLEAFQALPPCRLP
jgi:DNA-binding transcriptional LysR family regulator